MIGFSILVTLSVLCCDALATESRTTVLDKYDSILQQMSDLRPDIIAATSNYTKDAQTPDHVQSLLSGTDVTAMNERIVALQQQMEQEIAEMKETLEQNENKTTSLQEQITALCKKNEALTDKLSKYETMATEEKDSISKTETDGDVEGDFKSVTQLFDEHLSTYRSEIQEAVDKTEKCQSDIMVGAPIYTPAGSILSYYKSVAFDVPFKNSPSFIFVLHGQETGNQTVRISAELKELTNRDFKIMVKYYDANNLYGHKASITWMACPT